MATVTKRDGRVENFQDVKLKRRIDNLCPTLNKAYVSPDLVVEQVRENLLKNIKSSDLDSLAAKCAAKMNIYHMDYSKLAVFIEISKLNKETDTDFSAVIDKLYQNGREQGNKATRVICGKFHDIVMKNAAHLNSAIDFKHDKYLDYFGLQIMQESYLLKIDGKIVERPQHLFMRVAVQIHQDDMDAVLESYELMAQGYFVHSSNVLYWAGTVNAQLCSSFSISVKPTYEGIFKCLNRCQILCKTAESVGVSLHEIDARGCRIEDNTRLKFQGIRPTVNLFNNMHMLMKEKNSQKPGALVFSLELWHADIYEFIRLQSTLTKNNPDVFYAVWIPDLFMKRMHDNEPWSLMCPRNSVGLSNYWGMKFNALYERYERERKFVRKVSAKHLWAMIIFSPKENNPLRILFKDNCNSKSPQMHLGMIKGSTLGMETLQFGSHKEPTICNSVSIAVNRLTNSCELSLDWAKLKEVTAVVVRNLDKIINITHYPFPGLRDANVRNRPLAIGIQGFADALAMVGCPFDSELADDYGFHIFETIYFAAVEQSCHLAAKHGAHETYKGSHYSRKMFQFNLWSHRKRFYQNWQSLRNRIEDCGLRNSMFLCLAPTGDCSQIFGNSDSAQPMFSNYYKVQLFGEEFEVFNKHLMKELIRFGLWEGHVRRQIKQDKGSIQRTDIIPSFVRGVFKTAWEISWKALTKHAFTRAIFIEQGQSQNLFLEYESFCNINWQCWNIGLKSGIYTYKMKPADLFVHVIRDENNVQNEATGRNRRIEINFSELSEPPR